MTTTPLPRNRSTRQSSGRLRRSAGTVLLTAALLGAGGTLSAAAAAPSGPTCAQVLSRAGNWPGTAQVHGQTYRLYSDAYDSYLGRHTVCVRAHA